MELLNLYWMVFSESCYSISGLDFVMTSVQSSGRPSVASMSLGGGAFTPLDNAVESVRFPYPSLNRTKENLIQISFPAYECWYPRDSK